jgi:uncharacterized protein YyaL (SSP411 family)
MSEEPVEEPVEHHTGANRLIRATSPYLLQHAHNPVDWYEWGPEALERARQEEKPILLSIGYAACHWCHVMAHESFEDAETAAFMNEHFVSIKVDREQRPDIDAIYMDAVQAMTGHGGWPLTAFLTPDGEPFFAGTYFPPDDRHGLPAFRRVLTGVAEAWLERRSDAVDQGKRVATALARGADLVESRDPLTESLLRLAHAELSQQFDQHWGGFGPAPKFPQPMTLEFLLRMHVRGYPGSLEMVTTTLDRMADGGIHDQIGGGFHRYSTDERWLVPHFEKMLYDNALLARLYVHAGQVTGNSRYHEVAVQTLRYLLTELEHGDGGFYSSQDADSEGFEGTFFTWTHDEVAEIAKTSGLLPPQVAAAALGVTADGNWEEGRNVLWRPELIEQLAGESPLEPIDFKRRLGGIRHMLFERREKRERPATDDKVLTAWNGLAIQALAVAATAHGEWGFLFAAERAADFVLTHLRDGQGRLLRSWRDGRASGPGYADDYAMMAAGCLALYEATFETRWMIEARRLADDLIRLFHDPERGGFFQTGSDAEQLLVRPRDLFDNAVPSGNSVAAEVLQRLALLTGDVEYERAAVSALRVAAQLMTRAPTAFGHALGALDLYLSGSQEVAIAGWWEDEGTWDLIRTVQERYLPNTVLALARPGDQEAEKVIPLLADRDPVDGRAAAYVCERFACGMPVTDPAELAALLGG